MSCTEGVQQKHAHISGINPQEWKAAAPTGAMMADAWSWENLGIIQKLLEAAQAMNKITVEQE